MQLEIRIASFIPKTLPNYTVPMPGGAGKTMIPPPALAPFIDCFHTDQRSFSPSPTASVRMRSTVLIDTSVMQLSGQSHHCDNTVSCNCANGHVNCDRQPSSSRLTIENFITAPDAVVCSFQFLGAASNPCVAVAPDIDWSVYVRVQREGANAFLVSVKPGSTIEPFLAFEMHASIVNSSISIFQVLPAPGKTPPRSLGPQIPVTGSARITA